LPKEGQSVAKQVALHEAGHAVAMTVLGVRPLALSMIVVEGRLAGFPSVPWIICGLAEPGIRDTDLGRVAKIALAGREARRLWYASPEIDAGWKQYEQPDVANALHAIGFQWPNSVALLMDKKLLPTPLREEHSPRRSGRPKNS